MPSQNKHAMKYPQEQFNTLVEGVRIISQHTDISKMHPCSLHYIVSEQYNANNGQSHNQLVMTPKGELKRLHNVAESEKPKCTPIIEPKEFKLYPEGCNDSHIETAVRKAMQLLN